MTDSVIELEHCTDFGDGTDGIVYEAGTVY